MIPSTPANELERLNELRQYSILDTFPEEEYEDITLLASQICNTPVALISLIDTNRQWFKSHYGVSVSELPRELAFCAHAINDPDNILIIPDSRLDERFRDNPMVKGEPFVVFYTGVPLVNPNGFSLGTLCVIDSKPNVLNDTQINSLKALSKQVVRLFELRKNKKLLEDSKALLELKNSELEQFARIAAHDLKSPLNSILGITQLLKEGYADSLEEEAVDLVDMLNESSTLLKSLVDGILNHSKSELSLKDNKEKIDFSKLCSSVIKLLDSNNHCTFILPSSSMIFVNKTALEQILINLISNSIKYNDQEKTIVEIGLLESDNAYNFFVKDNGPGIKEELQKRIFNIFEVLGTDRYGNRGNGIGLSTVKKLIEGLGGNIIINSKVGNGTIFEFSIPK